MITSSLPTLDLSQFSIITTTGGPLGMHHCNPAPPPSRVVCPACNESYPLAIDPIGFAFGPNGATVRPGYVERCPLCKVDQEPGAVLEVRP